MNLTKWHTSTSTVYPELIDKETSEKYIIVRRNVTSYVKDDVTFYQYEEKMVPREDWNVYEDVLTVTPYTETKTGYYGESEKTFYGVPDGHVTVVFGNYNTNYSVNRVSDRVTVSFDTLTEQTDITINVK